MALGTGMCQKSASEHPLIGQPGDRDKPSADSVGRSTVRLIIGPHQVKPIKRAGVRQNEPMPRRLGAPANQRAICCLQGKTGVTMGRGGTAPATRDC